MKLAKWAPPGLAVVAALLLASGAPPAHGQARVTVFEGARVITGDGSPPIENAAIVVTGDRITAVGPPPAGAGPPGGGRGGRTSTTPCAAARAGADKQR